MASPRMELLIVGVMLIPVMIVATSPMVTQTAERPVVEVCPPAGCPHRGQDAADLLTAPPQASHEVICATAMNKPWLSTKFNEISKS